MRDCNGRFGNAQVLESEQGFSALGVVIANTS